MPTDSIETILQELKSADAQSLNLLARYRRDQHLEYEPLWLQDSRLYRAFGRAMVSEGHPAQALELVSRGLTFHPEDPDLLYLRALALSRGGNIARAEAFARELLGRADLENRLRAATGRPSAWPAAASATSPPFGASSC